jgi:hypothetical protein
VWLRWKAGAAGSRVASTHLRVMTQARVPGTLGLSMNQLPAEALPLMRSRLEGVQ